MSGKIIDLEKYKLTKQLEDAKYALEFAHELRNQGIHVPNDIFGRLQQIINRLESKLD